jgi:hypothetical protein
MSSFVLILGALRHCLPSRGKVSRRYCMRSMRSSRTMYGAGQGRGVAPQLSIYCSISLLVSSNCRTSSPA